LPSKQPFKAFKARLKSRTHKDIVSIKPSIESLDLVPLRQRYFEGGAGARLHTDK